MEPINHAESVYFLDLIVENVRCFGERQILDLSDGNGKPARWTVMLGDNGTGKSTLLQCLAALELSLDKETAYLTHHNKMLLQVDETHLLNLIRANGNGSSSKDAFTLETSTIYVGGIDSNTPQKVDGFSMFSVGVLAFTPPLKNLKVYAYGASRRMGHSSLSDTKDMVPKESIFFDDVDLINAEEWLLQAYFAVQNAEEEEQTYFENRYDKIKTTLIQLLEDALDFRIRPITKNQPKPAIEVETPYGWVEMKALSLGYQTLIA